MSDHKIEKLIKIMNELREKCPWDKKQTIQSLRHLTIEEVYELSESIQNQNYDEIKKELGDLLLHIVFYSKIASENNEFSFDDVITDICKKLVDRHPHIYGDISLTSEDDVKSNWEKIKLKEGRKSILAGVPKSLPTLIKSYRIQEKVSGIGFDWKLKKDVISKIKEEINELEAEIHNNTNNIEDEFGDLLFSLVNYSRFLKINPDDALNKTNQKFIKRFKKMENIIQNDAKKIEDLDLNDLNHYWLIAKKSS
ncbi:nucleoside triphosphate pyrophosphohydrolase [Bacteroidota bacterium]|nr:nucleoside triphosphate pyrophosphohydrolase [Bacteroidota bacterium]